LQQFAAQCSFQVQHLHMVTAVAAVAAVMVEVVVSAVTVAIMVMAVVTVAMGMAEVTDRIMVMRQHQFITHHNRIMRHNHIMAMVNNQCTANTGDL
jgi:hypothetical protein